MLIKNILQILIRNKQCHQLNKVLNERLCSSVSRKVGQISGKSLISVKITSFSNNFHSYRK